MRHCVRKGKFVEARVFKVDHPAASDTDQVVMSVRFKLKTCSCARVTYLASQTDFHKCIENPVNGGSRNSREATLDLFSDLVCCRVVMAMHQCLQDGPPLHGQRDTSLTAQLLELSHLRG
jgi:hypothetical protein